MLSRCQRFDFTPVSHAQIVERLQHIVQQEGAQADAAALQLLARRAAGSMRDSQSLLEQLLAFVGDRITVQDVHAMLGTARDERLRAILQPLIERDAATALAELEQALAEGVDPGQLAEQLIGSLRDMMAALVGCPGELLMYHLPTERDVLREQAEPWGMQTLLAAAQILDQAVSRMRQSVHARILLELALIRIARLEELDELSTLLAQLQTGAGGDRPAPRIAASPTAAASTAKKKVAPPSAPLRDDAAHGDQDESAAAPSAPHTPPQSAHQRRCHSTVAHRAAFAR